jgi:hypothetical protein
VAKKKKLTVAEANRVYFQVLANTRASLGSLAVVAGLVIALLGVVSVGPLNALSVFSGYELFSILSMVHLVLVAICAGVMVLSMSKKLLYRFQVFFSTVMAGMAAGLVYSACVLTVPIASFVGARGKHFSVMLFHIVGLFALALMAGATVVHVLMLRHRLRVGHSEERTLGNIVAVSGSNRSTMYWIILAVVAVVPNVLTQGQYLLNSFGIVALIFLACVTPSLPVEFGYLAYLKSKDRVYWEERPRRRSKKERRRLVKKVSLWVFGIVGGLALFWALAKYLPLWLA